MKASDYDSQLPYFQNTLRDSFTCIGKGLHTGLTVSMTVMPAAANNGYRFIRRDMPMDRNKILAIWHTVSSTHLGITVANSVGVSVGTIEHLLAALQVSGIDNADILLDGPEVPIMDGSARSFMELIETVGKLPLAEERKVIVVNKMVGVTDGDKRASLSPSPIPWIDVEIEFAAPAVGRQFFSMPVNAKNFSSQVATARTFGFVEQLETLWELGFARGGSLNNTVLVNGSDILNKEGLRFADEFVRHKALDCIGSLALAGATVLGRFDARYPGHKLNHLLLHELMINLDSYDYMPVRQAYKLWLEGSLANLSSTTG